MEAEHVWNGLPLANCSNAELTEAKEHANNEIARLAAINLDGMKPDRVKRLKAKNEGVAAYLAAVDAEMESRA